MSRIRVFLGLSSIKKIKSLKTIFMEDSNIEIVGEASDNVEILLEVGSSYAEAVVIDLPVGGKDSGLCSHLLAEYPDVKVFAVSEEGDKVYMYQTTMLRREIFDTSIGNLSDLIRKSMKSLYNGWDVISSLPG